MPFLSVSRTVQNLLNVIRRYPLECAIAVCGTISAVQLIESESSHSRFLSRILLTLMLALPAFLALHLRARFRQLSPVRQGIEYAVVAVILVGFYCSLQVRIDERDMIHFAIMNVVAHLFVAVAGFAGRGSTQAFWQFNRILFIRIITAAIFTAVLFAGLAGALASFDALFAFAVKGERYAQLAAILIGVFQTFFFLAELPLSTEELEDVNEYPRILKIFAQYVLLPLVSIYLCILLAYEIKIVLTQKLPNGWVTNLILGYGIAGILSILLLHPLRHLKENQWIQIFSRWFYRLLLPLVILMWVAILMRISQYGLTIERVIVLALAIWLTFIALLFLFQPSRDIRIIPFSLALTGLLVSLGGWSIAAQSQRHELKLLLQQSGLWVNNQLVTVANEKVDFQTRQRITSIVRYLVAYHGLKSVDPIFNVNQVDKSDDKWDYELANELIRKQLHLDPVEMYETADNENIWFSFFAQGAIPVANADLIILAGENFRNKSGYTGFQVKDKAGRLSLYKGDTLFAQLPDPKILLAQLAKNHNNNVPVEAGLMMQNSDNEKGNYSIYYQSLSGLRSKEGFTEFNCSAIILVKWK